MGLIQEFKEFAMKGSVVDLAVGVVIGGAFGNIVNSVVKDIIMPPIGLLIGGIDFSEIKIPIKQPLVDATNKTTKPGVYINIGTFLNNIITFVIIAASIFMVIKLMNTLTRKKEAAPPAPAAPTKEEVLLTDIRDILKAQAKP
jgi:large conductance mechanosensitive channel